MSNRKKEIDLSSLIDKYSKNQDIVKEIEKTLIDKKPDSISKDEVEIDSLYDISLFKQTKNIYSSSPVEESQRFLVNRRDNKNILLTNIRAFLNLKDNKLPVFLISLTEEEEISFVSTYLKKEKENILFFTHMFISLKDRYSEEKLSLLTSMSPSQIRNIRRLFSLPDVIKDDIKNDCLSYTKARLFLNLKEEEQKKLYLLVKDKKLSTRDIELLRKSMIGKRDKYQIKLSGKRIIITFLNEEDAKKTFDKIYKNYL